MKDRLTILCGDAVEQLALLDACSVECFVTSCPYDSLRKYGGYEWDFEAIAEQIFRVLVDGGVLCWNVGDSVIDGSETLTSFRQAIYFVDKVGFRMHDTMIWRKNNFANPESARYHQIFEYVFVLSKGRPRCFNPIKDKQNAQAGRIGTIAENTYTKRDGEKSTRPRYVTQELGMRGNVWDGNTRGQEEMCAEKPHPAMMPKWLARDLIISWSNPGDTVCDPMAGSGTVGTQAIENGRNALLIDCNPEYCELMRQQTDVTPGFQFT